MDEVHTVEEVSPEGAVARAVQEDELTKGERVPEDSVGPPPLKKPRVDPPVLYALPDPGSASTFPSAPPQEDGEDGEGEEGEEEEEEGGGGGAEINPEGLLVYQLKEELRRRGFDPVGRKPVLVERLKAALAGTIEPTTVVHHEPTPKPTTEDVNADLVGDDKSAQRRRSTRTAALAVAAKVKGKDKEHESEEEEEEAKPVKSPRAKSARAPKAKPLSSQAPVAAGTTDATIEGDDGSKLKIISWNVNGLNALLQKQSILRDYLATENPDVLCLQETKWNKSRTYPTNVTSSEYKAYWSSSIAKAGYAGTAVFSKIEPVNVTYGIGIAEHDQEGRVITVEYKTFFLVNTYIPNSGQKLERLAYRHQWEIAFLAYLKKLEASKPVVWCGDLNVAHKEIDLANPKTNKKTAGFTPQEREDFTALLASGFVDTWRHQNPDKQQFTFWSTKRQARERNIGWRLDYFVVSESFMPQVVTSFVRPNVQGSDHCPIGLLLQSKDV